MRYRQMSPEGDYVFSGASPFLINSPQSVAQAILTRLRLYVGEWFLDNRIGLNKARILGYGTATTRDQEIQRRILLTEGVLRIVSYQSAVENRDFRVTVNVDSIYGPVTINETF